jgi:uncharacterized membrane protein YcaP (DUF421 family)
VLDLPAAASIWTNLTDLGITPLEKVLRSLLVFAFLVVALRLGGKRELAQINVLDLAVLLLVSNALQNAMIGSDNSLAGGVLGASVLFTANYVFVRLTFRSPRAQRLLEGVPRVLVRDGKPDDAALRHEAISATQLSSIARERGFDGLDDVALMVLETDGHMAVMGPQAADHWREDQAHA